MNYFYYLKKAFPYYVLSGILLGMASLALVVVFRYSSYLTGRINVLQDISARKAEVISQIQETDKTGNYFMGRYGMDITDINSEKLIFSALDSIKADLKDAQISATMLTRDGNIKQLPVEISATVASYRAILDYMEYVDAFRLPDYKINDMTISQKQTGEVFLSIKGALVMPSLESGM